MRVTSVDIYASNSSNFISLSYRDPASKNPFQVKSILGLDADEITPKFYRVGSGGMGKYYDLTLSKRDVVVQIALNPTFALGKSYSGLRDELYKLISSSRTGVVQLQFKDGATTVAAVSGFITKFESPQFAQSPEVQLTIECGDPMLRALAETVVPIAGLNPQSTVVTDALSTAPHGFRFGVKFTAATVSFSIKDAVAASWTFAVDLTGSPLVQFAADDELRLSSEYNNRYLHLIRGGVTTHLVDRIVPNSVWPVLFPGANPLVCSNLVQWDHIKHFLTYWGV